MQSKIRIQVSILEKMIDGKIKIKVLEGLVVQMRQIGEIGIGGDVMKIMMKVEIKDIELMVDLIKEYVFKVIK